MEADPREVREKTGEAEKEALLVMRTVRKAAVIAGESLATTREKLN
jgi:hypothetical protein